MAYTQSTYQDRGYGGAISVKKEKSNSSGLISPEQKIQRSRKTGEPVPGAKPPTKNTGGGTSSKKTTTTDSTGKQVIDLRQDPAAQEYIAQRTKEGEALRGPVILTQRYTARDYVEGRAQPTVPRQGSQLVVPEEASPVTKLMIEQENISVVKTFERPEYESVRLEQARAVAEQKKTGTELPGGAGGFFTRLSYRVERGISTFERQLPGEERTGDVFSKLFGTKDEGVPFTDLVSREQALQFGVYAVPVLGEAKFASDVGTLAEKGKYGRAALLGSLPYVLGGAVRARNLFKEQRLVKDLVVSEPEVVTTRTFVGEGAYDVSRSIVNVRNVRTGERFRFVSESRGSIMLDRPISGTPSFVGSEESVSRLFAVSRKGSREVVKDLATGEFRTTVQLLEEDGYVFGRADYLSSFTGTRRVAQGRATIISEKVLSESGEALNLARYNIFGRQGLVLGGRLETLTFARKPRLSETFFETGYSTRIISREFSPSINLEELGISVVGKEGFKQEVYFYRGLQASKIPKYKKPSLFVFGLEKRRGGRLTSLTPKTAPSPLSEVEVGNLKLVAEQKAVTALPEPVAGRVVPKQEYKNIIRSVTTSESKMSSLLKAYPSSVLGRGKEQVIGSVAVLDQSPFKSLRKVYNGRTIGRSFYGFDSSLRSNLVSESVLDFGLRSEGALRSEQVLELQQETELQQELVARRTSITTRTPIRGSGIFYPPLLTLPSFKKKKTSPVKISKKKKTKTRLRTPDVYVLPDLRSVSITEQELYRKRGGGEAVAPRLTKDMYNKALSAFKGYGTGLIPTEQMRTRRIKI